MEIQESCNIFSKAMYIALEQLMPLYNSHKFVSDAFIIAREQLVEDRIRDYEKIPTMLANADMLDELFHHTVDDIGSGRHLERIPQSVIEEMLKSQKMNASATLLYGHALFETAIMLFIESTIAPLRGNWVKSIEDKKLSVRDLQSKQTQEIENDFIKWKFDSIESAPLMKKIEFFFWLTRPPEGHRCPVDYAYDADRLENIDSVRHKIAHESALVYEQERLKEDLDYLAITSLYFSMILVEVVGLSNIPGEHKEDSPLKPTGG